MAKRKSDAAAAAAAAAADPAGGAPAPASMLPDTDPFMSEEPYIPEVGDSKQHLPRHPPHCRPERIMLTTSSTAL
jgi:hypothetical protein